MAAQKFLTLINGIRSLVSAKDSSAGAGDAGAIVALDSAGKIASNMMPNGVGADSRVVAASETLAAGDQVNLWLDGGALKTRKADATAAGKESHGFVEAGVTSGANATVIFDGTIPGLSGLTIGAKYFLGTTAGAIVATAPSAVGNVVQPVGVAASATELVYERGEPVTIVS
jgi:hypothetical protein